MKRKALHRDGSLRFAGQELQLIVDEATWKEWVKLTERLLDQAGELLGFEPTAGLMRSGPRTRMRAIAQLSDRLSFTRAPEEPAEPKHGPKPEPRVASTVGDWVTLASNRSHRVIVLLPNGFRMACGAYIPRSREVHPLNGVRCKRCAQQTTREMHQRFG